MLYLIGIKRPVGNPPGSGNNGIFSGYDIIDNRRICGPDIICGEILLEIALVIPFVQLCQSGLDPFVDTCILQSPVFIIPAVRPCFISMEEGLKICQLCIHIVLAGRNDRAAGLSVAVIIHFHQLVAEGFKLLNGFRQLICGSNAHAFQLCHVINHLRGHLCRIRAHRQSVDFSVLFGDVDEVSVIVENIVQIITTVFFIVFGQIRKAALIG